MRTFLCYLLIYLSLEGTSFAQATMTKIVFRAEAPDISPDSFAAKPKTLYFTGKVTGRVEEVPDPEQNLQGLIIADGKDAWMINLMTKTGRHMIDPGPTYSFDTPIVPPTETNKPPKAKDFQIGKELAFMSAHNVKPRIGSLPGPSSTHPVNVYETIEDGVTLKLYVSTDTGIPLESEVYQGDTLLVRLIYLEYVPSMPLDNSLFRPSSDIKISEAKN